jgi:hypothetical protein
VQLPFVPHTSRTNVSSAFNGVWRSPMASLDRVSNKRHGVIDTNDEGVELAA